MATERRVTEGITQSKDLSPKKSQLKGGEKQRGQSHPVPKFQESLNTVFREPLFAFTEPHYESLGQPNHPLQREGGLQVLETLFFLLHSRASDQALSVIEV